MFVKTPKVYTRKKKTTAKVSLPVKKYVKSVLDKNIENKHMWKELATALPGPLSSSWVEYSFAHNIVVGATAEERIGRTIKIKSIYIKGTLTPNADTLAETVFRVVIGRYRCSGVNATDDAIPLALATTSINDPINNKTDSLALMEKKYVDKFIIVPHPDINIAGDAYLTKSVKFKYFKFFKNPVVINYSGDKDHSGAGTNRPDRTICVSIISTDALGVAYPRFSLGYISVAYEDA